jgi:hypothetical protein
VRLKRKPGDRTANSAGPSACCIVLSWQVRVVHVSANAVGVRQPPRTANSGSSQHDETRLSRCPNRYMVEKISTSEYVREDRAVAAIALVRLLTQPSAFVAIRDDTALQTCMGNDRPCWQLFSSCNTSTSDARCWKPRAAREAGASSVEINPPAN